MSSLGGPESSAQTLLDELPMQIETKTLRFEIDDRFAGRQVQYEAGSLWVPDADRSAQLPMFHFGLSEVTDLYDGFAEADQDYASALRSYFDVKRPHVQTAEDELLELAGRQATVRRSTSRSPEGLEAFHLFVNFRLEGEFMQEFSADCPLAERPLYEPLFLAAISSATWSGDFAEALVESNRLHKEAMQRIDALTAKAEAIGKGSPPEPTRSIPEPPPFHPEPGPGGEAGDLLRLGPWDLELAGDAARWSIGSHSRYLRVEVRGTCDPDAKLLSSYSSGSDVTIRIQAQGVYGESGVPAGSFWLEDGSCKGSSLRLDLDGIDSSLRFTGRLTFLDGWTALQGQLSCSYENLGTYEVHLQVQLDAAALKWSDYQFSDRREIEQARAHELRCVHLQGEIDDLMLSALESADQLQVLRFTRGWQSPEQVLHLPAALFRLGSLESLHVDGFSLAALPDDWSGLSSLSYLCFARCGLESLPAAVLQLPQLRTISLDDNRLSQLPTAVDLPEVQNIDLGRNQLTELPAALVQQPKLRRMDLERNPWAALPPAAADLDLRLSLADRRRLLGYEYAGADGKGLVPWDDGAFHVTSHKGLSAAFDEFLGEPALESHAAALRFLARRSIAFQHSGPDDYSEVGNHRFGGMPDLPGSIPYPRAARDDAQQDEEGDVSHGGTPFEFLAQINCAELAPLQDYLPREGLLYFFLSTIHDLYGGSSASPARVIHYQGPIAELRSGKDLHIPAGEYFEMMDSCYKPFRASASLAPSVPSFYAANQNPHHFRGPAAELANDSAFLQDGDMEFLEDPIRATYPADHSINAYAFTQHEDPEHQAALAQRGAAEDRIILLTVKSRGDFQWGDAGDLFFVIHKSDLARGDFSNVFCTMESS